MCSVYRCSSFTVGINATARRLSVHNYTSGRIAIGKARLCATKLFSTPLAMVTGWACPWQHAQTPSLSVTLQIIWRLYWTADKCTAYQAVRRQRSVLLHTCWLLLHRAHLLSWRTIEEPSKYPAIPMRLRWHSNQAAVVCSNGLSQRCLTQQRHLRSHKGR